MNQPNPKPSYQSRHRCVFTVLLWYCFISMSAQSVSLISPSIGARHAAMGGTGVTQGGAWTGFHNPGGFGYQSRFAIGIYHETRFNIQQLSTNALTVCLPIPKATFGVSAQYFGYSNYNESKLGLGIGKKLGDKFSAGIQFDYINRFIIEQTGTIHQLLVEGGLIYEPGKQFRLGIHGFNPGSFISKETNPYPLPGFIKSGIQYTPEANLILVVEYLLQHRLNNTFSLGAEYSINKTIYIRGGAVPQYRMYTFGLGYQWKNLTIDIAFSNNQILGITPHYSMNYEKP